MPGKRIIDPSLTRTTFPEVVANNGEILTDWEVNNPSNQLVWARPIPLKLIGNSWMQGSYDAVSWDNYIENDHNYLRVSTDGGDTWRIIDLTGGVEHPPLTVGSPDGGLIISGDDTQVLTLLPATTTTPGSLSPTDKIRINDIEWYDVSNVGAGTGLYKDSTTVGDDVTFNFKTLVAGTGVTLTPSTDTITIDATGASGGEINTMSNVGTDGVGVFYQKNGLDFEMRNIASQTNILTVTLDELTEGQQDIDLNIIEANIDHDALGNFVVNEHIDHSAVSILTQEGITGGGDLTTTRTLTLSFDTLNSETSLADTDLFAIYDASESLHNSLTWSGLKTNVKTYTDTLYTPLTRTINAGLGLSGGGSLNQNRILYLDINGLPSVPYSSSDYIGVYDTSALTHGKITLGDILTAAQCNQAVVDLGTLSTGTANFDLDLYAGAIIELTSGGTVTISMNNLVEGDTGHIEVTHTGLETLQFAAPNATAIHIANNSYQAANTVKLSSTATIDVVVFWYAKGLLHLAVIYNSKV